MPKFPPSRKRKNVERRSREYLTPAEVEQLILIAKKHCQYGARDCCLILFMYRHGLRVSEVVALTWKQLDLKRNLIHVYCRKHDVDSTYPLFPRERHFLSLLRQQNPEGEYVFISERKSILTEAAVRKMVSTVGRWADLDFPIHPHMLRHSTEQTLANEGHDICAIQRYLGHKFLQSTA